MMFTDQDAIQLRERGITVEEAAHQLRLLRDAPPPITLDRPCTIGDGIIVLEPAQQDRFLNDAEHAIGAGRVMKFVPASGAATRMFKDLIAAQASTGAPSQSAAARTFFERLDDFPFAQELRARSGIEGRITSEADERRLLRTLLDDLRYAVLPKALIPFHRIGDVRTAFEEHLLEAGRYACSSRNVARLHFTAAREFRADFADLLAAVRPRVAAAINGDLEVSFSEQQPSTDTLAATPDGEPFRLADRSLLFRPAGHGALLANLHALDGDIVVIKNIDNILPFEKTSEVAHWKRLLIGYLAALERTASGDRPLRVCGVVKNEGEPGGAPFWVRGADGTPSRQIVEPSQVDLANVQQRRIFESSTHFNPVDIVCGLRGRDGKPFDLPSFVDRSAVFRTAKSHDGRELLALERPGLWNGAMAGWHTVFVEVPASTFAPVKTVFDLLRVQHQSL
jgi:hypothetical protein